MVFWYRIFLANRNYVSRNVIFFPKSKVGTHSAFYVMSPDGNFPGGKMAEVKLLLRVN
jgi:hypothetical protein